MANKFLIVCGGSGVGLLGQRKVLGLNGEMHIDVREEVDDTLPGSDPFSINVKLDLPPQIGTARQLLVDMKKRVGKTIRTPEYQAHTLFLANSWPGDEPLKDGLARAPALSGGAIRQADNAIDLDRKLKMMIYEWAQDIGPANPIEFWIVSSTAGGTGEGVHRYVGERIVEILSAKKAARVILNFVRIGQVTYNAVDPDRTSLNTFFGIAADAAFKVQLPRKYEGVGVTTRWFYFEVPPVGVGPAAKPIRTRLVEVMVKAIMLDELQESINTIVVNDGIGLVRVGYWGKDFDENLKYHETLKQLLAKLNELIEPDEYAGYVYRGPAPDFEPGEGLQKLKYLLVSEDFIYQQMNSWGWVFPKYTAPRFPEDPNKIWELVQRWKHSISQWVSSVSIDQLEPRFVTVQVVKEELEPRRVPLSIPSLGAVEPYTPQWFEKIDTAQQVKAWASHLLGTGQSDEGLLSDLHKLARECSNAQHPGFPESLLSNTQKKANNLRQPILEFIETLVKIIKLWELRKVAEEMLDVALDGVKKVRDVVQQQEIIARGAIRGVEESPFITAELYYPLDQITKDTWLRMLDEAVRRQETDLFKKQVLAGAAGLTWSGLLSVLGLMPNAQAPEIKNELQRRMGRMCDRDGTEHEAQWWQANEPPGITRRFAYRIFPRLEPHARAELGEDDGDIQYLYTGLDVIGLYVLAFEGLARYWQDMVTTPAYLLSPFVPQVCRYLDEKEWDTTVYGRPQNKLSIMCAGVGGEPLYKPALMDAGLTLAELKRLAEFYELYDPESGIEVIPEMIADIREIRRAIDDKSFHDYQRLAEAIIRRMAATDAVLIESPIFKSGTVWEVSFPPIGLRLRTQKAILFLRQEEGDRTCYDHLAEITREKDAAFLVVVDIADIRSAPMQAGPQTIWFRPEILMEMATTSEERLPAWLGRFITTQVDVKPLLPYNTKGKTDLFFGRDYELTRLIGGSLRGGIIIGAHRSGKTSLLYQLGERLQQRDREVIGPIPLGGIQNFRPFFEITLNPLGVDLPTETTPESWASVLRAYGKTGNRPVFLLDDVDDILKLDAKTESRLGRQMRSLHNDSKCEFYLAGHSKLREAIALEEGPFRNFAEEVILTGLTETAGIRLIQEPLELIGFDVTDDQARRIFDRTAGVPVLIQEFCIRLLLGVREVSNPEIEDSAIEEVEQSPDYLGVVFQHYEYAQEWDSMSVMLITAILGEVTRHEIMLEFSKRGVSLTRDRVDEILDFLVKFGVLEEYKAGYYRVLPRYLSDAIKTRDPDSLLDSEMAKGINQEG